ncbi:MAG: hypothetical protein ABIH50_00505 [bacterium]
MVNKTESEVLAAMEKALSLKGKKLTLDSMVGGLEEWDSLGHLAILSSLDELFDGKIAAIKEMATANSVKGIMHILKDNSLI